MARLEPEKITLRIAGVNWQGWKSAEIARQMDAVCSEFAIGLTDRWSHGAEALPLAAGMPMELLIGEDTAVIGYLDKVDFSLSTGDHSINVSGRDKSGDLVDCSAIHKPGTWKNLDLLEIAKILAAPFEVEVSSEVDAGPPFDSFKLEEGETAFDALNRLLKEREILALPDGRGGIVFSKLAARKAATDITQGGNILQASSSYDMSERFSDYIVKGQRPGNDNNYGASCARVTGEARDGSVERYRPFMIRAETQCSDEDAVKRAKWEATTRAARAVTVSASVMGWRQDDGKLWEVNSLVHCDIPYLKINQELLIYKVTFSLTMDSGTVTKLDLKDPKAFEPEPPKKKEAKSGGGGGSSKSSEASGGDLQQESASSAWTAHKELTGG